MATQETTTPYQATPETGNPEGGEKRDSVSPYKELLDKAAHEARHPPKGEPEQNTVHPLVEKVTQYVPESVTKMLGIEQHQKSQSPPQKQAPPPGPPKRPHHDTQIEEFVRDQHRSREIVGEEKVN